MYQDYQLIKWLVQYTALELTPIERMSEALGTHNIYLQVYKELLSFI